MSLYAYSELKYPSTWKQCSYDDSNQKSMLDSDEEIINFDRVKTRYLNKLGKSEECAASVDALGEDSDELVYMVEFKNGGINTEEIRKKITESLLMYCDITHSTIKETRNNMEFVLVYNPDAVQLSYKQKKALHLARKGKAPCPFYNLDKYEGTYFSRAYMVSDEWFSDNLMDKIKSHN